MKAPAGRGLRSKMILSRKQKTNKLIKINENVSNFFLFAKWRQIFKKIFKKGKF